MEKQTPMSDLVYTVPWFGPGLDDMPVAGNAIHVMVQIGILSRIHGPMPSRLFVTMLERHFGSVDLVNNRRPTRDELVRLLRAGIALATAAHLIVASADGLFVQASEAMLRTKPWWLESASN
jgi:hypothetical protein